MKRNKIIKYILNNGCALKREGRGMTGKLLYDPRRYAGI